MGQRTHDATERAASSGVFVAYYSAWKVLGLMSVVAVIAVCPLLPGFSQGLTYTGFLYSPPFHPFLVASCISLGALSLLSVPLAARALRRQPAMEIDQENVRVYALRSGEFPLTCVTTSCKKMAGNIFISCPNGKQLTLPIALLRNPKEVLARLGLR